MLTMSRRSSASSISLAKSTVSLLFPSAPVAADSGDNGHSDDTGEVYGAYCILPLWRMGESCRRETRKKDLTNRNVIYSSPSKEVYHRSPIFVTAILL